MKTNFPNQELQNELEKELNFYCDHDNYDHWISALKMRINDLIVNDFPQLIIMLYRLDISELKLKNLLKDFPNADAAGIICDLVIERQLQKIKSRKAFSRRKDDIDENEKW